jgi:flagellar basal-body rod protein FlgB
MNVLGDKGVDTLTTWLQGLSQRQQAIGTNIANIDTPGYQRQDVSFEAELQQATSGSTALVTTDPKHIAAVSSKTAMGMQTAEALSSPRLDQNNVSIDQEMLSLSDTQMRYSTAATALTDTIATIREAIRGS